MAKTPWSILLLLVIVGYAFYTISSPLGYGGDIHQKVASILIYDIVDGGGYVTWTGVNGVDSQYKKPINFTFESDTGDNFLQVASASRGKILSSHISLYPIWHNICDSPAANTNCGNNPKWYVVGWKIVTKDNDDIQFVTQTNSDWSFTGPNKGRIPNVAIDKSNTFKITVTSWDIGNANIAVAESGWRAIGNNVPHNVRIEVINPNFYTSEDYYHNIIPSGNTVRMADCPLPTGYIAARQTFHAGDVVSLDKTVASVPFRVPVAYFCDSKPVTVYGAGVLISDRPEYHQLLQTIAGNGNYIVPTNQAHTYWYVTQMSSYLKLVCPDTVTVNANSDGTCPADGVKQPDGTCKVVPVYDSVTNACNASVGVVTVCNGQWVNGICVDQATNQLVASCNLSGGYFDYATKKCIPYAPQTCTPGCASDEYCNIDFYPPKCQKNFFREGVCPDITIYEKYPTERTLQSDFILSQDACWYPRPLKPICNPSEGQYLGELP